MHPQSLHLQLIVTNKTSLHASQVEGAHGDSVWGTKNWLGWADRGTRVLKGTEGHIIRNYRRVAL